jgi:hypothetical protein
MKQQQLEPDDRLAAELQREAQDATPVFSELLHARVMQVVRAQTPRRAPRWRIVAAGLAAAIALAAGLWAWHALAQPTLPPIARDVSPSPVPVTALPQLPALPPATHWEHELWDGRLAYLERDAQRFGRFLIDQVSVAPEIRPDPSRIR